jgi:putative DNA primase/helicase
VLLIMSMHDYGVTSHITGEGKMQNAIATSMKKVCRGRDDVVPRFRKSKNGEHSWYAPICANEWQKGICQKPEKSCRDCPNKEYVPLDDDLLIKHLNGNHILGVYPLLEDNTCWFVAFDFDNHDGSHDPLPDVVRFYEVCEVQGIPCYLLRSKSGTGYHVDIFFDEPVPAWKARLVGFALLQEAQAVDDDASISSYDRMFPSQDELTPTRPLGNLIALPFQGKAAQNGHTLFLDPGTDFQQPFPDQLEVLKSIARVPEARLDEIINDWDWSGTLPNQNNLCRASPGPKR